MTPIAYCRRGCAVPWRWGSIKYVPSRTRTRPESEYSGSTSWSAFFPQRVSSRHGPVASDQCESADHSSDGNILVSDACWAGGLPYRIGSWSLVRSNTESSLVLSKIISSRASPVRS